MTGTRTPKSVAAAGVAVHNTRRARGRAMSDLPWPFRPDKEPYHFVEIAPNEWIRVVLAGDYNLLLEEHLKLRAAARDQIEAAQEVLDVWRHYGRPVSD
jgi:hypothetical protein